MTYKIKVKEGEKVRKINVVKIINQYENLIYKICIKWANSFAFDRSIEIDDLAQELKIKFLCDLKSYDYKEGSMISYMSKIAINFLINKRKLTISNGSYPTNVDGSLCYLVSTSSKLNGEEDVTIEDTLKSKNNQHEEYYLDELVVLIRKILNKKKYKPKGFKLNGKTFSLEVFDLLYYQNEKFVKTIKFQHRCRVRSAKYRKNSKTPRVIVPTTKMIGDFIGVDKRAVNSAYTIIKQTISEIGGSE
jgi:hypothetical protein